VLSNLFFLFQLSICARPFCAAQCIERGLRNRRSKLAFVLVLVCIAMPIPGQESWGDEPDVDCEDSSSQSSLERAAELIHNASCVSVFTGAGISVDSGRIQ
jgi:hypothetical protein